MNYGMNFSNCVFRSEPINYKLSPNFKLMILPSGYIEIPDHSGYFYDFVTDRVISMKKGEKFKPGIRYMKIYSDKDGNRYVNLLRTSDTCRHNHYISDIKNDIYKIFKENSLAVSGVAYIDRY